MTAEAPESETADPEAEGRCRGGGDGILQVHAGELQLDPTTVERDHVRFLGVAVGTGTYAAANGLEVRIREEHLELIAERLVGTQIRDLHREDVAYTVGAVQAARVSGGDVVFEGEVGIEPHATIVRSWPESVAFSVGFRFSPQDLEFDEEGVADLPGEFFIDHIALVGEGQDPDARLVKLLNEARSRLRSRKPDVGTTMTNDGEVERLRVDLEKAREAAETARADLAKTQADLGKRTEEVEELRGELDAAQSEAAEVRAELASAKSHLATGILKLELQAGADVDLRERQEELEAMDLQALDGLRLELAEQAAEAQAKGQEPATRPATSKSSTREEAGVGLDLDELSPRDTVKLGLIRGVL